MSRLREILERWRARRIQDGTERLRELVSAAREEEPPEADEESVERSWLALRRKIDSL